jgi:hypothetical protein
MSSILSKRPPSIRKIQLRLKRSFWWQWFQYFEEVVREYTQDADGPAEFECTIASECFFPSYKIHMVDLSSAEFERTYVCFPLLDMLLILEKALEGEAISEVRERSNKWMESFSDRWRALGPCSFDEGNDHWLALGLEWWGYVHGQNMPDYLSSRKIYDMLGIYARIAKGEVILPEESSRFPDLRTSSEEAAVVIQFIGGYKAFAQIRKELRKGVPEKTRTLCPHCCEFFDRSLARRSIFACEKVECRKACKAKKERARRYDDTPIA